MQRCPPNKPTKKFSQARIDELDLKFMEHVGAGIEEIWTEELRLAIDAKRIPKTIEAQCEAKSLLLLNYAGHTRDRLEAYSNPREDSSDTAQLVVEVLNKLSFRQREVVKLRWGIGGDNVCYTLDEVASIFKCTRERIRQIEDHALRIVKSDLESSGKLVGVLDAGERS